MDDATVVGLIHYKDETTQKYEVLKLQKRGEPATFYQIALIKIDWGKFNQTQELLLSYKGSVEGVTIQDLMMSFKSCTMADKKKRLWRESGRHHEASRGHSFPHGRTPIAPDACAKQKAQDPGLFSLYSGLNAASRMVQQAHSSLHFQI